MELLLDLLPDAIEDGYYLLMGIHRSPAQQFGIVGSQICFSH
jgi:hypothetical protein